MMCGTVQIPVQNPDDGSVHLFAARAELHAAADCGAVRADAWGRASAGGHSQRWQRRGGRRAPPADASARSRCRPPGLLYISESQQAVPLIAQRSVALSLLLVQTGERGGRGHPIELALTDAPV